MINEILKFIEGHRIAACIAVMLFAIAGIIGAIYLYSIASAGPMQPVATPAASAAPSPTVAPAPSPTVTPTAIPTPVPSPTMTPDMAIDRSITPLDQYAPNHMVQVDRSTGTGLLSIDLFNSDTGGQYAYRNDTYTSRLTLADVSNTSIDRIRIHTSCVNGTGSNYTLYEDDRIDYVLLRPGDKISRTVGFKVAPDAPEGLYKFRIVVSADLQGNGTWPDLGCSYESGLNILKAPQ
jgi:hypothetical protein